MSAKKQSLISVFDGTARHGAALVGALGDAAEERKQGVSNAAQDHAPLRAAGVPAPHRLAPDDPALAHRVRALGMSPQDKQARADRNRCRVRSRCRLRICAFLKPLPQPNPIPLPISRSADRDPEPGPITNQGWRTARRRRASREVYDAFELRVAAAALDLTVAADA